MQKLYTCSCGSSDFYQGILRIRCRMCGKTQPGILGEDYVPVQPTIISNRNFISKETASGSAVEAASFNKETSDEGQDKD